MLKSWSIENFKSIANSGELQLAPVTVLAGLNSSGKSSLLQSILMISQTLSSPAADRPLLPNGPMVQLGTLEHILNDRSGLNTLTIGFQLTRRQEEQWPVTDRWKPRSVRVITSFNGCRDRDDNTSALEASIVTVDQVLMNIDVIMIETEELKLIYDLTTERFPNVETNIDDFLKNVTLEYRRLVPSIDQSCVYRGRLESELADFNGKVSKNQKDGLVFIFHFLPSQLVYKFKLESRRKALEGILRNNEMLTQLLDQLGRTEEEVKDFKDAAINIEKIIHESLKEIKTPLPSTLATNSEDVEGLEVVGMSSVEILSSEWITNFFTSKIRYLGPLRADPGTVQQQFAPTSELDNVGQKGEYAAVVYQANQFAQVDYYDPFSSQVEQATLQEALDKWAQYLGVASQIRTERLNGVTWQVAMKPEQKPRMLPEVGFGVSQVLPILVMGLLAPREALLLIEQPELHLHPRVQARLGDFFMGLAKCGKQCLIETHSENLVSQLRYHIVQAGGQEKSDCMIHFVDQDETGASRFDPVEISPNGNILNWPDGFFDETMLQEDRITAASLKKRAGNAKKG